MRIVLKDIGRIKPYVRMTRKGKWVNKQAQEYLSSKDSLEWKLKEYMSLHGLTMIPKGIPLKVRINVGVPTSQGHIADTDNILKAILDACNDVVFDDDHWIDDVWIVRHIGDETFLEMTVERMRR